MSEGGEGEGGNYGRFGTDTDVYIGRFSEQQIINESDNNSNNDRSQTGESSSGNGNNNYQTPL